MCLHLGTKISKASDITLCLGSPSTEHWQTCSCCPQGMSEHTLSQGCRGEAKFLSAATASCCGLAGGQGLELGAGSLPLVRIHWHPCWCQDCLEKGIGSGLVGTGAELGKRDMGKGWIVKFVLLCMLDLKLSRWPSRCLSALLTCCGMGSSSLQSLCLFW